MCRHVEARPVCLDGETDREEYSEVEDFCIDIAEGLDLAKQLLRLADGPWKECGHSGRLPLEVILRDCAHRIAIEALRCRMALEASGTVLLGTVIIVEESRDSDGPEMVTAPEWCGPAFLARPVQEQAGRFALGSSPAGSSRENEPTLLGASRR